jgi:hypothetical protein
MNGSFELFKDQETYRTLKNAIKDLQVSFVELSCWIQKQQRMLLDVPYPTICAQHEDRLERKNSPHAYVVARTVRINSFRFFWKHCEERLRARKHGTAQFSSRAHRAGLVRHQRPLAHGILPLCCGSFRPKILI